MSTTTPTTDLELPVAAPVVVPDATKEARVPETKHPVPHNQEEHLHDEDDDHDEDEEHEESLIPHKDHPHEDLIDMTPMVDIVFFLLIFFLTTSMTALQAVMNLPNPQKATDRGSSKSVSDIAGDNDTLIVKIDADNTYWIDDEQILSEQDLRMRIKQAVEEGAGKSVSLIVQGNADASHGAAIRVFDAGAAAGVGGISLLVKEETE